MQVHHEEGEAIHLGPRPCVGAREGNGEASVGENTGQPLSRETSRIPGADAFQIAEGNTDGGAKASVRRPGVVGEPGMCRSSLNGTSRVRGYDKNTGRNKAATTIHFATAQTRWREFRFSCLQTSFSFGPASPVGGKTQEDRRDSDQSEGML